jgi:hypothetical protein
MNKPIAFFDPKKGFYWAKPTKITAPTIVDVEPLALYTKRTWVGLTDKELNLIGTLWHFNLLKSKDKADLFAFVKAIEAKLKEKNT